MPQYQHIVQTRGAVENWDNGSETFMELRVKRKRDWQKMKHETERFKLSVWEVTTVMAWPYEEAEEGKIHGKKNGSRTSEEKTTINKQRKTRMTKNLTDATKRHLKRVYKIWSIVQHRWKKKINWRKDSNRSKPTVLSPYMDIDDITIIGYNKQKTVWIFTKVYSFHYDEFFINYIFAVVNIL